MWILHLQHVRANFRNYFLFKNIAGGGIAKNPAEDNTWSSAPKAEPLAFLPEKQQSLGWEGRLSARPSNQAVILKQGRGPKKTAASKHGKQGGLPRECSSRITRSWWDLLSGTFLFLPASKGPPGSAGTTQTTADPVPSLHAALPGHAGIGRRHLVL